VTEYKIPKYVSELASWYLFPDVDHPDVPETLLRGTMDMVGVSGRYQRPQNCNLLFKTRIGARVVVSGPPLESAKRFAEQKPEKKEPPLLSRREFELLLLPNNYPDSDDS